jgi:hypothetical protein
MLLLDGREWSRIVNWLVTDECVIGLPSKLMDFREVVKVQKSNAPQYYSGNIHSQH